MPLSPGTRVGSFEIIAAIGAGVMGEVYSARDTRLGGKVALKMLPDAHNRHLLHLDIQPSDISAPCCGWKRRSRSSQSFPSLKPSESVQRVELYAFAHALAISACFRPRPCPASTPP